MMDYSMIGQIQKAKQYAEEPERVTFHTLTIEFTGSNNTYIITLDATGWHCTCPGFQKYGICPHIMALERLFGIMLKRDHLPYANGQNVVSDVEKASRYAREVDRIHLVSFEIIFQGGHSDYHLTYQQGQWECDSFYFQKRGICSHVMTMERLLKGMVEPVMMLVAPEKAATTEKIGGGGSSHTGNEQTQIRPEVASVEGM